jgi:cell division septum initiation protein DivIVA
MRIRSAGDEPDPADLALDAVATTLRETSLAVDGLKKQLEDVAMGVDNVKAVRLTEEKIGQLFVQAQRFIDTAIAEAHDKAQHIIMVAEYDASRLVTDAHAEAETITTEARRTSAIPTDAVRQLSSTIDGFSRVNAELIRECEFLREVLAPAIEARANLDTTSGSSDSVSPITQPVSNAGDAVAMDTEAHYWSQPA